MTPVKFLGQNVVFGENQPEYKPLPAHIDHNDNKKTIYSCWQMSDEEFDVFKRDRKIWFHQITFGQPMQPIGMEVTPPFINPELHN